MFSGTFAAFLGHKVSEHVFRRQLLHGTHHSGTSLNQCPSGVCKPIGEPEKLIATVGCEDDLTPVFFQLDSHDEKSLIQ